MICVYILSYAGPSLWRDWRLSVAEGFAKFLSYQSRPRRSWNEILRQAQYVYTKKLRNKFLWAITYMTTNVCPHTHTQVPARGCVQTPCIDWYKKGRAIISRFWHLSSAPEVKIVDKKSRHRHSMVVFVGIRKAFPDDVRKVCTRKESHIFWKDVALYRV